MEYEFVTAQALCKLMSVSRSFLRDRRSTGEWKEGAHWVRLNDNNHRAGTRFNKQLCLHWLTCKGTPAHERAIEAYLRTLEPSPPMPPAA